MFTKLMWKSAVEASNNCTCDKEDTYACCLSKPQQNEAVKTQACVHICRLFCKTLHYNKENLLYIILDLLNFIRGKSTSNKRG